MKINSGYARSCSISLSFSEGTRSRGVPKATKTTKGSREAAFDDLSIPCGCERGLCAFRNIRSRIIGVVG